MDTTIGDDQLAVRDDDGDGDDVVVLPWWQHPVNILTVLVATALIAGMIGWLIADDAARPNAGEVDVGFLQDMRVHHDQAVQMGFLYLDRPGTSPGLQAVARGIVLGQGIEIGRMIQQLRDLDAPTSNDADEAMGWMGMTPVPAAEMPGMASDGQLAELASSEGAVADGVFIELMTEHHSGGLHMADTASSDAESAEVRRLAEVISSSQRDEIVELERLAD